MPRSYLKPVIAGIKVLGDRLLVTVLPDPAMAGDIILPENQRHITRLRAKIAGIGPKVELHHNLFVGDVIMARRESGYIKVQVDGVEYAIMPISSVLCVEYVTVK